MKSHQVNLFSVDFSFLKSLCIASEGPLDSLTLLSKPVWSAAADAAKEWMNEWRAAESAEVRAAFKASKLYRTSVVYRVPRNKGRESSSATRKESIDRVSLERPSFFPLILLWMRPHFVSTPTVKWKFWSSPLFRRKNSSKPCSEKMAVAKPVWWVSGLLTRFEEQLPCRIGPQTHHSRINVQQNKESLIHISQWKFSLVISGLTRTLTKINGKLCSASYWPISNVVNLELHESYLKRKHLTHWQYGLWSKPKQR